MLLKQNANFNGYQAQNKKEHVLGADPSLTGADGGRTWWRSDTAMFRGWDGAAAQNLTNLIEQVMASGALTAVLTGKRIDLSIAAASGSAPGTMSALDKAKLDAATNGNTPSALVQRDGNGDFSAGNITAHLIGLADNSTLHGGQTLAQVRDFSQTTGQRTALSAISDFNAAVRLNTLDQLTPPAASVSMNSQRLVNGADPVNPQDFATKNYTDSVATGLDTKASCRLATIAALASCTYANGSSGVGATLTATANGVMPNVDSQAPAVNNRILVKNQASQPQHGLYIVTSVGSAGTPWVLTRASDADSAAEVTPGLFTYIEEGTTLQKTGWTLSSTGTTTIGTTNLPFTQFSGAGTYLNGSGLSLTGSTFAVVGTTGRITVGAAVDIAATYAGQSSITTLGTIATGVWQGTPVAVAYGGTGGTTPVTARAGLGAIGRYAADLPAGTTLNVTHGLGTLDVLVMVVEKATGSVVITDVTVVDVNTITIGFGDTQAASAYRVIVLG